MNPRMVLILSLYEIVGTGPDVIYF